MKTGWKKVLNIFLLCMFCTAISPAIRSDAAQAQHSDAREENDPEKAKQETGNLMEELNTSEIDDVLKELQLPKDMSFGDLVMDLIRGKDGAWGSVGSYIEHLVLGQWRAEQIFHD